jgi:hypothetical protein
MAAGFPLQSLTQEYYYRKTDFKMSHFTTNQLKTEEAVCLWSEPTDYYDLTKIEIHKNLVVKKKNYWF